MYFTERKLKYADLVIPFTKCPFKKVELDCPFIEYWELASIEKQIQVIEDISEEKLELLRYHHRLCQGKKIKHAQSRYSLKNIDEIFNEDLVFNSLLNL